MQIRSLQEGSTPTTEDEIVDKVLGTKPGYVMGLDTRHGSTVILRHNNPRLKTLEGELRRLRDRLRSMRDKRKSSQLACTKMRVGLRSYRIGKRLLKLNWSFSWRTLGPVFLWGLSLLPDLERYYESSVPDSIAAIRFTGTTKKSHAYAQASMIMVQLREYFAKMDCWG
ncbi:hypothetical protein IFM89_031788 [Coptis chinensis]|uniref:Uncharacterized protein n=1 Tax=Coptis chinensis TaxID=261450 RepID=A0A835MBB1_9MAGN|nr:hypothetical protein IFM89_031788 [Coptis chinensis]